MGLIYNDNKGIYKGLFASFNGTKSISKELIDEVEKIRVQKGDLTADDALYGLLVDDQLQELFYVVMDGKVSSAIIPIKLTSSGSMFGNKILKIELPYPFPFDITFTCHAFSNNTGKDNFNKTQILKAGESSVTFTDSATYVNWCMTAEMIYDGTSECFSRRHIGYAGNYASKYPGATSGNKVEGTWPEFNFI